MCSPIMCLVVLFTNASSIQGKVIHLGHSSSALGDRKALFCCRIFFFFLRKFIYTLFCYIYEVKPLPTTKKGEHQHRLCYTL